MSRQIIEQYINEKLPNVTKVENFGYSFFLYDTEKMLPFVTFAASDNEYDSVSNLNRDGVFRVNIGISKGSYTKLFPGNKTDWDYTELNQFMPHPDYAAQHFICVLNPESNTLSETLNFIEEAYFIAKSRFEKKQASKMRNA